MSWTVVMPVKRLDRAKSRLRGAYPGVPHADLVLALVLDTVAAALACPAVAGVTVVYGSAEVAVATAALGARTEPEPPGGGLNDALRHAAAGTPGPVAALAADLPALRPADLAAALGRAADRAGAGRRCFVADAGGTGTTLLAAPAGPLLGPRFGTGSAAAHAASGAAALTGAWPSLRRDVDTAADLRAATALGLGVRTAALLRAAAVGPPAARPR